MNHSCEPNAETVILSSNVAARLVVRATRAIASNQQIFIAYTKQTETQADVHTRFWRLLWDYAFECDCDKCSRQMALEMR
jgi:SET domain-containing protein